MIAFPSRILRVCADLAVGGGELRRSKPHSCGMWQDLALRQSQGALLSAMPSLG